MIARRSLAIAVLVAFVVFLGFGLLMAFRWGERTLFSENETFRIRTVEVAVEGEKYTREEILELFGIREGMNLFALSLRDLERKGEALPDIESVHFERRLPDQLTVRVKERLPVAQVLSGSEYCLISSGGVLLERRALVGDLPIIKGLSIDLVPGDVLKQENVVTALNILRLCRENPGWDSYLDLRSLDVSPLDYVRLRLEEGVTAKVPNYSRLEFKLSKLATILQKAREIGARTRLVDLTPESSAPPVRPYDDTPVAWVASEYGSVVEFRMLAGDGCILEEQDDVGRLPSIEGLSERLFVGSFIRQESIRAALEVCYLCKENPGWEDFLQVRRIDVSERDYLLIRMGRGASAKLPLQSLEINMSRLFTEMQRKQEQGESLRGLIDLTRKEYAGGSR